MITRPIRRLLTLSACVLALQGCGQSGDLYLPGEVPPSQRPPVTASPGPSVTPTPATLPRPETTP